MIASRDVLMKRAREQMRDRWLRTYLLLVALERLDLAQLAEVVDLADQQELTGPSADRKLAERLRDERFLPPGPRRPL